MLISFVFLFGSLSSFFFPTKYLMTDETITIRSVFRKNSVSWNRLKRYYIDKNGVFLSPFAQPSRLENFRGIYLRFGDNRECVINYVKSKMGFKDEQDTP